MSEGVGRGRKQSREVTKSDNNSKKKEITSSPTRKEKSNQRSYYVHHLFCILQYCQQSYRDNI